MSKDENNGRKEIKFVDLFAGLGGTRIGFEQACQELELLPKCVLTSEIKPYAINALKANFEQANLQGDICNIMAENIPDFDFLLGGFPCQSFSTAGKGLGFSDTRGTLFFEVERILKEKKPYGFLLENVDGLVLHDKQSNNDSIGKTLNVIIKSLENIGYSVNWKVLDSQDYGIPQSRKRVYIVGTVKECVNLEFDKIKKICFGEICEHGLSVIDSRFTKCLLKHYRADELYGKAIKDKRGGKNNIHSWNIGLKGELSKDQTTVIEKLFLERRKKHWAAEIGIDWMDGMPLTTEQIATFCKYQDLKSLLDDMVAKGYLVKEHPKKIVEIKIGDGKTKKERIQDETKPMGYNIVSGKLSFEFTKILDINDVAPTLVAMDVSKMGVVDNVGIRKLTLREGLRLFGYPETYTLDFLKTKKEMTEGFDLLGNTVVVPVVKMVIKRTLENYKK